MADGEYNFPTLCAQCKCEIDSNHNPHRIKNSLLSNYAGEEEIIVELCDICSSLADVVLKRRFFVNAEIAYKKQKARLDRLKFGADYLE